MCVIGSSLAPLGSLQGRLVVFYFSVLRVFVSLVMSLRSGVEAEGDVNEDEIG